MLPGNLDPAQWGCIAINAYVLHQDLERRGKLGQASTIVPFQTLIKLPGAGPWYQMFGS